MGLPARAPALFLHHTSRLHLVARQASRRNRSDVRAEQQLISNRPAYLLGQGAVSGRERWLQLDAQSGERRRLINLHPVFSDLRKAADDRFESARIKVIAAQVDHIIRTAQDTTFET